MVTNPEDYPWSGHRACLAYKINPDDLKTQSQQRTISEARSVAGWLARELGCVTLSDIGKLVNRDGGSISSAVRRLANRMPDEPELSNRVRSLKQLLEKQT